jgi:SAM-dependent methyltransferase
MSTMKPKSSLKGTRMPPTNYRTPRRIAGMKRSKSLSSPFDDLAPEYDAWFDKEGSLIYFMEVQAFKSLLPTLPKPWLEIGVGSGRFAQALGIGTGVDPSIKLIKMARRRGVTSFLGWGEQELFDEESFGAIFLIVTLCFLDSPLEVLKEASRILMPGGKLVLGMVLKESPWGQFYQTKKAQGHRFYKFATFYSFDDVVRLIAQAGFATEKTISTLFQRPGEVRRTEKHREGYFTDAGFTVIVGAKSDSEPLWS